MTRRMQSMLSNRFNFTKVFVSCIGLALAFTPSVRAQKFSVLNHFNGPTGAQALSGLTFDKAGNLYGTTSEGGLGGAGLVFELVPGAQGTWTEQVIYKFGTNQGDGVYPVGELIFDTAGNLY